MPREDRLRPPEWEEGRSGAPNGTFHVIGARNRKLEGLAKVTGRALYTDDLRLPRMLHGKLLRSRAPARAHPGASTPARRSRCPACTP